MEVHQAHSTTAHPEAQRPLASTLAGPHAAPNPPLEVRPGQAAHRRQPLATHRKGRTGRHSPTQHAAHSGWQNPAAEPSSQSVQSIAHWNINMAANAVQWLTKEKVGTGPQPKYADAQPSGTKTSSRLNQLERIISLVAR